jgi:hypothetical protein
MSGRGINFLENWIQQNVTEANRKGSRERGDELAAQCIADAAAIGVTIDDMEPEWGSVKSIIYEAMQDILGTNWNFGKRQLPCGTGAREMKLFTSYADNFIREETARLSGSGLWAMKPGMEWNMSLLLTFLH